jgi:hypothetical protein
MEITKQEVANFNPARRSSKAFSVLGSKPNVKVSKERIPNVFLQESESEHSQSVGMNDSLPELSEVGDKEFSKFGDFKFGTVNYKFDVDINDIKHETKNEEIQEASHEKKIEEIQEEMESLKKGLEENVRKLEKLQKASEQAFSEYKVN